MFEAESFENTQSTNADGGLCGLSSAARSKRRGEGGAPVHLWMKKIAGSVAGVTPKCAQSSLAQLALSPERDE